MDPLTLRSILRTYADGVEGGAFDRDITDKRTRKFVALLLRTASNDGAADQPYAGMHGERGHQVREDILSRMSSRAWGANVAFFVEVAGGAKGRDAYGTALEAAYGIVRSI